MTETREYVVTGYSGEATTATVTIRSFDKGERMRRALKGIGTAWVAALGSVFIPVAHFLLVPSFLLYGVYTFWERLGAERIATAGRAVCPDCGREQSLETGGRWHVPRDVACRYCQRRLRLADIG